MRTFPLPIWLFAIVSTALAQSCSQVSSRCAADTAASSYCSSYISASATTVRQTIIVSTIYEEADEYTTITIDQCPTRAPSTLAKREAEITPPPQPLDKRQVSLPQCLSKYDDSSSHLSSACSCFDFPVTTSTFTRRRAKTITLKNAPTTTITTTHTVTSERATPSCVVTDQPPNGPQRSWKRYYAYCNTFSYGGKNNGFVYSFENMTICEALNKCAAFSNHTSNPTTLFDVTYELSDGSPIWSCVAYPSYHDLQFDPYGIGDPSEDLGYILVGNK